MEAGEAEVGVALVIRERRRLLVLTTEDLAFRDGFSPVCKRDSLAMSDSLDQGGAFKLRFQQGLVDLRDTGSVEVVLKVCFHVSGHLLVLFTDNFALLNGNKNFVEV